MQNWKFIKINLKNHPSLVGGCICDNNNQASQKKKKSDLKRYINKIQTIG